MSTPYCYLSLILQRGNRDLYRKLAWVTNLIDEYTKHLGNREDPNRGGETIHELLPQNLYIEILASVWWYNKNKNNNTKPFLPTRELHINRKHCLSCRGSSLKVPHGITRLLLLPPKPWSCVSSIILKEGKKKPHKHIIFLLNDIRTQTQARSRM